MKTKTMLIALLVCLFASLFCVGCTGAGTGSAGESESITGGSESISDESESVHTHEYVEVGEVASTCVKQGVKAHYECEECKKLFIANGDEYTEATESQLKLPLAAHSFDKIVIATNPTKTVYNAFETFVTDGIKVVKHCSVAGCDGEEVAAKDVTFAYEKEGADKLTGDMTKVIVKAAGYETDLAVTVNKLPVTLPVIEGREYTGDVLTADITDGELYTVTENLGGTEIGEYDVKLTLIDSVNYAFEGVEGATATVKFAITKTSNGITMPETIADINCGGTPVIEATAKENAVISYIYSASEDGEYAEELEGGFVAGTYYVKAVAAETNTYKETVSSAMSFVVNHIFGSWNTENAEKDTGVCDVCHNATSDEFNKVVTADRQDVILSNENNAITLEGISDYESVKSIAYGEISLGSDVSALTVTDELKNAVHGEQNLTVVVTDGRNLDHTIQVPVTIVTESISTLARLKEIASVSEQNLGKRYEGKYFILANDINVDTYYINVKKDSDPKEALIWDSEGNGFAGTFDGRNHSLVGGDMYGGGLFCSLESATVKNVTFDKVNAAGPNRTLIAGTLFNTTLENVRINIVDKKSILSPGSYFGILATHPVKNLTLKNVTINAAGSTFPWIIGHHSTNCDPANYHFENVEIIADSVDCFSSGAAGKLYLDEVDGLKFTLSGSVDATDPIDPKEFGEDYEYSYDFAAPWAKYTKIKSVKLGDIDITDDTDFLTNTDTNTLVLYISDYIGAELYNKTATFIVEFDVGENNSVKVALNVNVLDTNVRTELETRQDIILKDATGDKTTFALDLGEYSDCTVTKIEFNGEELTVTDGGITIPDSMINGTHGENTLYVSATKGNANYGITVPVTVVTETFSDIQSLLSAVKIPTDTIKPGRVNEGKYYTLAGDINAGETRYNTTIIYETINAEGEAITNTNYSNIGMNDGGFAGTFDGRGYTITGGVMNAGGIFGCLDHATIKDVNFKDVIIWSSNSTLIAGSAYYSTIENVNITIKGTADTIKTPANFFGVISAFRAAQLTLTNVHITAENATLNKVLGSGWNTTADVFKCTDVTIRAKKVDCIAINSNGNTKITEVPGITVTSIEE